MDRNKSVSSILLGVVIPVYNGERYLEQAVRSVLEQPCKDLIVVIINDGSRDRSLEIARQIAETDFRVTVLDQENQGVSAARNAGIEHCLSRNVKYIGFLDADDLWVGDAIDNELADKMCRNDRPALYAMGTIQMSPNGDRFSYPDYYFSNEICIGNDSIWRARGHFAAIIYSALLLRKWNIRFNTRLKYSEDKIFTMQAIFLADEISFIASKSLYVYRANLSSAMSRVTAFRSVEYYLPIIDGWIWSDSFLNSYFAEIGKRCTAGQVLASIYFLDMASDSFMKLEKGRGVLEVIRNHPHGHLLAGMRKEDVSFRQYKDAMLLLKHPIVFECKYRGIGIIRFALLQLLKVPFVRKLRDNRRYPLTRI